MSEPDDVDLFREPSADDEGSEPRPRSVPRIVSVSGAKGGAGKSVLASNLAVYLASIGRRVVLVDADVNGANLHTMLGVRRPPHRVRTEDDEPIEPPTSPVLLETSVPGLSLWHAGLDEPSAGHRRRTRRRQLESKIRPLDADYAVVDIGSGTPSSLVDFHLAADVSVFVTLPEPTAVESTYRFIRYAFVRYMRKQISDPQIRMAMVTKIRAMGGAPSPLDLWRRLEDDGDPMADAVRAWLEQLNPTVVLNQTRLRADLELGEAMRTAARRRLGVRIEYAGYIDYDDTVWTCVRNRRLLLVESPGTKASKSIEKIARRLLMIESGKRGRALLRTVPPESHHDLLEVDRGATDEEIRRAYKRMREIYAENALCCYGLFEPAELDQLRTRLEEAYDVLLDPARRRPYELSVFPAEPGEEEQTPAVRPPRDLPPPPDLTPDTEFHGGLLRAVREAQGVELNEIATRTKVSVGYLRAIEDDDFAALPAPVYVRGFVTELAKCLKLDPLQVSRTYVKRLRRYIEERPERA